MSQTDESEEQVVKKPSKLPLIGAVLGAVLGGAGAFYAMYSGALSQGETTEIQEEKPEANEVGDIEFVALDPIFVTVGDAGNLKQLRFSAYLEVDRDSAPGVLALAPRIVDVLNTYLRAVEVEMLEDRRALIRLRAHMLHRVQIVAGDGVVQDLLITEFILS